MTRLHLTTQTKAKIAGLICAGFMMWPAVHRAIVAIYDTNAWRLGGFAMYATPPARTRVSIFEKRGGEKKLLEDNLPAALQAQRRLYVVRRGALGSLLPPDALAEAFFQTLTGVDRIEVVITREILSASTARIERREIVYEYDRPPAGKDRLSRRFL